MTEYLIAFNDEWVPDLTDDDLREASKRVSALRAEMKDAGVLIFTGGLDDEAPVFSVDPSGDTPLITDGPYAETKEQLGGYYLLECKDLDDALNWASQIPEAKTGAIEVRPIMDYEALMPGSTNTEAASA